MAIRRSKKSERTAQRTWDLGECSRDKSVTDIDCDIEYDENCAISDVWWRATIISEEMTKRNNERGFFF